jgi:hypothetical protein
MKLLHPSFKNKQQEIRSVCFNNNQNSLVFILILAITDRNKVL